MSFERPFRIVHLSDLHLTSNPGDRRFEPKVGGQLTGMNSAFAHVLKSDCVQRADLLLVTGDITDRGAEQAWRNFDELVKLAGLKARTLALAGNHDVCGLGTRFGWPETLSRADLERASNGLRIAGQPQHYPWTKLVHPEVAIFALDTNNSGNLSPVDNAIGRIGDGQMQRFAELLRKHKDVPLKIVAIHHSPNIPEYATALRRRQAPMSLINRWTHQMPAQERRTFRQLCLAARVRLVLHGHLHQAEDRRVNGLRIIGAPATTEPVNLSSKEKRYRFYEYTIAGILPRVFVKLVTV